MKVKKVETSLVDYDGPIFPEEINDLNNILKAVLNVTIPAPNLMTLGETIEGFRKADEPTTEDGYTWFVGLYFKTKKGEIAVLFPNYDRKQLGRSTAIYRQGEVNLLEAGVLLERIQLRLYKIWAKELNQRLESVLLNAQGR